MHTHIYLYLINQNFLSFLKSQMLAPILHFITLYIVIIQLQLAWAALSSLPKLSTPVKITFCLLRLSTLLPQTLSCDISRPYLFNDPLKLYRYIHTHVFKFLLSFYLIQKGVLLAYVSVYDIHAWWPMRQEESIRSLQDWSYRW